MLEPGSIFAAEFLAQVEGRDPDGFCEHQAIHAGPWQVLEVDEKFAVVRPGDQEPRGVFAQRETACLVAAVLPALGGDALYATDGGNLMRFVGQKEHAVIGRLRAGHEEIPSALQVVAGLLGSAHSLALLLEAASFEVLVGAGRLVAERQRRSPVDATPIE